MAVFEEASHRAWASAVLPEVRRCWPGLAREPDDVLRERLRRAACDAARMGLMTRGQWLRYANVALALKRPDLADAAREMIKGLL